MKIGKLYEYEWNGIKLGDKVMYNGREEIVIAIDVGKECEKLRYIVTDNSSDGRCFLFSIDCYELVVLNGYTNCKQWNWASLDTIQKVVSNETNTQSNNKKDSRCEDIIKSYVICEESNVSYIRVGDVTVATSRDFCGHGIGEHEDEKIAKALAYYDLFKGDE